MKQIRYILSLLAACAVSLPIVAQESDTSNVPDAKIMFEINSDLVDESFSDNAQTIELLDKILLNNDVNYKIEQIKVVSSSSIDGNFSYNERLSQRRIDGVRRLLEERYPAIDQSIFKYQVIGENWADLRSCVEQDSSVPYRSNVLEIIDNYSAPDDKEMELKELHYGTSWEYLKSFIFPKQRYGVGMMIILKEEYRDAECSLLSDDSPAKESTSRRERVMVKRAAKADDDKLLLAIKTNLLADLLSQLNLEVEIPIGNRYSASAEFKFPWWRGVKSDFTMQILSGHLEGKYWFGERTKENRLLGFSAGLFTGFGTYDIQTFKPRGTTGEFFELGVLAGYSHVLYKRLNMEYELGFAYLHSGYRRYDMADVDGVGYVKVVRNEYLFNRGHKNTFLPTRLKVSLVWNIETPKFWK